GQYLSSQIKDDKIASSFVVQNLGLKFPTVQRKLATVLPVTGNLELLLKIGLDSEKSAGLQETVD
ncbi:unnamed protein product, partial [Allacma fusca]